MYIVQNTSNIVSGRIWGGSRERNIGKQNIEILLFRSEIQIKFTQL